MLIVEDDEAVGELVALHLERAGFATLEATTAGAGWEQRDRADVIVLDRMLPDESGDAFLARLRGSDVGARVPVLMLTARASEIDRVGGLDAGADDYLTKPFSAAELVARIRALLRRVPAKRQLVVGDLVIDLDTASVSRGGTELTLTRREFDLLAQLASEPGRVYSRQQLLDQVWGDDFIGTERTVDQHIAQLRQHLGDGAIETLRGRGYRLSADA